MKKIYFEFYHKMVGKMASIIYNHFDENVVSPQSIYFTQSPNINEIYNNIE